MASIFRRKITQKVISSMQIFLVQNECAKLSHLMPLSIKLRRNRIDVPQFELPWSELLKIKPELENRLHPDTALTYLKNQLSPSNDSITDIQLETTPQQSIVFNVDREHFTKSVLSDVCNNIDAMPDKSTFFKSIPPENVIVEFSSPNIAKSFHYGHFRSTVIGNFVSNIHKYIGHDVTKLNYIGDWGLQYGILAAGFDQFGCEEKLKEDPLSHLHEVYKEANIKNVDDPHFNDKARKHFQQMETGDSKVLQQWKNFRKLSLKEMDRTYKRLGITFDETHGESMYAQKSRDVFEELLQKNVAFCNSDGALETNVLMENGREEKVILRKSDGTSLYLSRDIAAAIDRKNSYHFDSMYYVVDSSQSKHFAELFQILKSMGYHWSSNLHHVLYGRVLNFSTRKGNAVFLHDILNEAQERTLESMKNSPTTKVSKDMDKVADVLGITALIINDMYARRKKEYEFNWDRILKMKGDSGIALQYCHARLTSIKENCGVELQTGCDLSFLTETEACGLINQLARFDEAVYRSYISLDPCLIVHYLFKLSHAVGRANKVLTVKGQPLGVARARLMLFHASQIVLCKGLQLLGIQPLDHM